MEQTPAHRRDPLADPDGRAVAGRAGTLRAVADRLRVVSPLAAGRDLDAHPDRVAGRRRRARADHLGRVGGLHDRSGASARGRRLEKGAAQHDSPGGVVSEPADHGLGRSRGGLTTKLHLAVEQGQKPLSIVVTGGQRGDSPSSPRSWTGSGSRAPVRGAPGPDPIGSWPTRPPAPRPTVRCCAAAGSGPGSRSRTTTPPTDAARVPTVAGRRVSTGSSTSNATPWSAASTGSSATAPWPPGTTSSTSATTPPSRSPPSTSGSYETDPSVLRLKFVGNIGRGSPGSPRRSWSR